MAKRTAAAELPQILADQRAKDDAARIKQLEKELEQVSRQLSQRRERRFVLPTDTGLRRGRSEANFLRVCVPDSHGASIDKQAAKAFLSDLDALRPREVVWMGDHMDCGSYLDEKHTIGYVSQTDYNIADDEDAANELINQVVKRTPGAEHHYIEGNHEWRIEREIVGRAKGNRKTVDRLMLRNSPEVVLGLEKRGIKYYRRGACHMGLRSQGCIKLGKCMFTHGSRASARAAQTYAQMYGSNIVFAHMHQALMGVSSNVHEGSFIAWCVACICELQPLWRHTDPTNWSHGYGLQVVDKQGAFLHVHVPIISGESFLRPLMAQLGE